MRPSVAVVVPVAGRSAAREALANLERLRLAPGDEILLAFNGLNEQPLTEPRAGALRVISARGRRSSYHARNAGARATASSWLLFLDADCSPRRSLLDEYFATPIAETTGAIAGGVRPSLAAGAGVLARYARSRLHLNQRAFLEGRSGRPFAATANMLVRRAAWKDLGGFCEVRSGGDVDFCWRLQEAGWSLELREDAFVEHRHRESLRSLLRQRARYAAGHRWLDRRHPGGMPRLRVARGLARTVFEGLAAAMRRDGEEARFRALDGLVLLAQAAGRLKDNTSAER